MPQILPESEQHELNVRKSLKRFPQMSRAVDFDDHGVALIVRAHRLELGRIAGYRP